MIRKRGERVVFFLVWSDSGNFDSCRVPEFYRVCDNIWAFGYSNVVFVQYSTHPYHVDKQHKQLNK